MAKTQKGSLLRNVYNFLYRFSGMNLRTKKQKAPNTAPIYNRMTIELLHEKCARFDLNGSELLLADAFYTMAKQNKELRRLFYMVLANWIAEKGEIVLAMTELHDEFGNEQPDYHGLCKQWEYIFDRNQNLINKET